MNAQVKIVSFIQFQLPAIAWGMFIFVASTIPASKLTALVNYSDKVVHAGVFGTLCWLLHVGLFHQSNTVLKKYSLLIAIFITMLYGLSDEYHQMFTPGRSTDFFDLVADTVGGIVYAMIYLRFKFYSNE